MRKKDTGIESFITSLRAEEKSRNTIDKYERDLHKLFNFLGSRAISKEILLQYKEHLRKSNYKASSINSMLASVNKYLGFIGRTEYRLKYLRIQNCVFASEERILSRENYQSLCRCSGKRRIHYVMNTIAATGIRVSELQCFTVEAVRSGEVVISCKGKIRMILVPKMLKKELLQYARNLKIKEGPIFRTRSGKPIDRSRIWKEMKELSRRAKVEPQKVFPHNLRKLFARCFYEAKTDIAKLADVLGHSNVNTTRIYLKSTGYEHQTLIDSLRLVI